VNDDAYKKVIADQAVEIYKLREQVAMYEQLLAQGPALLYENLAAGLPPDERRVTLGDGPSVDELIAAMRGAGNG
jgi:hypothetical protein